MGAERGPLAPATQSLLAPSNQSGSAAQCSAAHRALADDARELQRRLSRLAPAEGLPCADRAASNTLSCSSVILAWWHQHGGRRHANINHSSCPSRAGVGASPVGSVHSSRSSSAGVPSECHTTSSSRTDAMSRRALAAHEALALPVAKAVALAAAEAGNREALLLLSKARGLLDTEMLEVLVTTSPGEGKSGLIVPQRASMETWRAVWSWAIAQMVSE